MPFLRCSDTSKIVSQKTVSLQSHYQEFVLLLCTFVLLLVHSYSCLHNCTVTSWLIIHQDQIEDP